MLRSTRAVVAASRASPLRLARAYSAQAGHHNSEDKHHGDEHHGDEHHDEHHDDHSLPLSESESIINNKTGIALGIVALSVAYSYVNSSYKESHDGTALVSAFTIKGSETLTSLKTNYDAYRARVEKAREVQEMMMFPSHELRSYNNLVTRIDSIPGQLWPSGSNTQLNTIKNFDELAPRKQKESPFY
ncbi:hypothetical protein CANINC_001025 [Pichia inconspicua]|uniref:Uncharacterized protein n=1 Tax=Pichia inconspicua TaxID=52247 RepID=A0A4T0X4L6_9ASCO|nr:hypothetical protein CANINC_001025 [[Candida] inconspicua]